MPRQAINRAGQKYGKLTFIQRDYNPPLKDKNAWWICQCECGNIVSRVWNQVTRYKNASCGCSEHDHVYKHGKSHLPEYKVWATMIQRCTNNNYKDYHYYGGRGIQVCDEWMNFEDFYKDMGLRPSDNHSIERDDNNGNYEPLNCRWATTKEQNQNSRGNIIQSKKQANGIRELHYQFGFSREQLVKLCGCSYSIICKILSNKTWT